MESKGSRFKPGDIVASIYYRSAKQTVISVERVYGGSTSGFRYKTKNEEGAIFIHIEELLRLYDEPEQTIE